MVRRLFAGSASVLVLVGLVTAQQQAPVPVDDKALASVESRPGDWLSYGRDYYEQRFSPLDQINDTNAAKLGLACTSVSPPKSAHKHCNNSPE
jgi:glucose dehydrogenase